MAVSQLPHDMPRIDTVYGMKPEKVPFDFPELIAALAPHQRVGIILDVMAPEIVGDNTFNVLELAAKHRIDANRPEPVAVSRRGLGCPVDAIMNDATAKRVSDGDQTPWTNPTYLTGDDGPRTRR